MGFVLSLQTVSWLPLLLSLHSHFLAEPPRGWGGITSLESQPQTSNEHCARPRQPHCPSAQTSLRRDSPHTWPGTDRPHRTGHPSSSLPRARLSGPAPSGLLSLLCHWQDCPCPRGPRALHALPLPPSPLSESSCRRVCLKAPPSCPLPRPGLRNASLPSSVLPTAVQLPSSPPRCRHCGVRSLRLALPTRPGFSRPLWKPLPRGDPVSLLPK